MSKTHDAFLLFACNGRHSFRHLGRNVEEGIYCIERGSLTSLSSGRQSLHGIVNRSRAPDFICRERPKITHEPSGPRGFEQDSNVQNPRSTDIQTK